jgi:beta-galactosidase
LFCVPELNVASFQAVPAFDPKYQNAVLQVELELANEGTSNVGEAELRFELTDPNGAPAACVPHAPEKIAISARKSWRQTLQLDVPKPLHWEAEHPRLYTLSVILRTAGKELETVSRRVGFRQIELRGNEMLINGQAVKLRGTDRHEAEPLRGRSLTSQMSRQDAELFKAANCNFVRTSHYPPAEEFIEACDELGLYVEEEAPFCFFDLEKQRGLNADEVARHVIYANLKMVERDLTHPSVVIWSIANESKWAAHFETAARAVAKRDPSRPRTFMWFPKPGVDCLNVAAEHYPTPESVKKGDPKQPKLFSEYCHLPAYVPHEMYTDPSVDDDWGRLLQATWENLYPAPGALGGAVWCGVDDVFHVPPAGKDGAWQVRGVAAWGVLDGWRRPKPEYWHMLKCYSPFHVLVSELDVPAPGQPLRVAVENRYEFSNLRELKTAWQLGARRGMAECDVKPRAKGEVFIEAGHVQPGDVLHLRACDAQGRLVDEYELPIGKSPRPSSSPKVASVAWKLNQSASEIVVQAGPLSWAIDRKTAQFVQASVDGRIVLNGGPTLAYVPTFSKVQQRAMKGEEPQPTPIYGSNWRAELISARQAGDEVEVRWSGCLDEGRLEGSFRFSSNGELIVEYQAVLNNRIIGKGDLVWVGEDGAKRSAALVEFKDARTALVVGKQPNEKPVPVPAEQVLAVPRQLGLLFQLPRGFETLRWKRRAQWNAYPQDHIGRPKGTARAFLPNQDTWESLGQRPEWPWSLTACELGSRDFRSTKENIYSASLADDSGYGVEVLSDGRQSARAFVQNGRVHWLLAQINNPPSETFMAGYFDPERKAVPLGKPVTGSIRLHLVGPSRSAAEKLPQ